MKRITLCLALLMLGMPAFGQGMDFQQLLAGKEVPHTLKLKDLNGDWRRLTIQGMGGQKSGGNDMMSQIMQAGMMAGMGEGAKGKKQPAEALGGMLAMSMFGGLFGGGGGGLFDSLMGKSSEAIYTRGQTVSIGGESFLVTYRHQKKEMNLMQMALEAEKAGGKEPDFAALSEGNKLNADSTLAMSLINIKTIASLSDIRPFDMNQEIEESGKAGGGLMEMLAHEMKSKEVEKPEVAENAIEARPASDTEEVVMDINLAILMDKTLSASGNTITVHPSGNTFALKGFVRSAALKTRAGNLAQNALKKHGSQYRLSNQVVVRPAKKRG